MDRDDARLVARLLACRISGDREQLNALAASSLMQISICATVIRKNNSGDAWGPATRASAELMAIGRSAGDVCDEPLGVVELDELQTFADCMSKLAGETAPRELNRAERRAQRGLVKPPKKTLYLGAPPRIIH